MNSELLTTNPWYIKKYPKFQIVALEIACEFGLEIKFNFWDYKSYLGWLWNT